MWLMLPCHCKLGLNMLSDSAYYRHECLCKWGRQSTAAHTCPCTTLETSRCTGPDATTGLLREAVEAPQDAPASPEGPLGMLRRRMTLLDAGQVCSSFFTCKMMAYCLAAVSWISVHTNSSPMLSQQPTSKCTW